MFDKEYQLSLTKDYVSHWGMIEAVRELTQNALDSNSPFEYNFQRGDEGEYLLHLYSEFATLSPQSLLLGSTSKASDPDAIGSFGEGYKIALLVLTRIGHPVVIKNGKVDWHPVFKYSKRFEKELLVIDEVNAVQKQSGLTFVVGGLTEEDVAAIRASCLQMQDHIGAVKQTTKGDILLERSGMLYVGGLYICKTDLEYGYNVKPAFIKLERDRQTVSSYDLSDITSTMWYETKEFDRVAEMIEAEKPDVRYARFNAPEMVKEACYNLFRQKNPGAIAVASQDELKRLVAQGMERVVVVGGDYHSLVTNSTGYRAAPFVRLVPPVEKVQAFFDQHKFNMHDKVKRAFAGLIDEAKLWKLK